jgi:hypothetical protein
MTTSMRHWRNLLLVTIIAALCFGGSFTCKASKHDEDGSAVIIVNSG